MSLTPVEKKIAEADALNKMKRYQEAVAALKEALNMGPDIDDKMSAAGLIVSITMHNILEDEPELGTPEYLEVRKYLKIALDAYDNASPDGQAMYERVNNVEGLRGILELMEANQPLSEPEPAPQEKKKGCFIATATFDSAFAPEVITLREFRDEVLSPSSAGRLFIRLYYLLSPPIARLVSSSQLLKSLSRFVLNHVVSVLHNKKGQSHE